jgi:hypothetical protein
MNYRPCKLNTCEHHDVWSKGSKHLAQLLDCTRQVHEPIQGPQGSRDVDTTELYARERNIGLGKNCWIAALIPSVNDRKALVALSY